MPVNPLGPEVAGQLAAMNDASRRLFARGQVVAGNEGFHRPLKELEIPEPRIKHAGMHGALREMLAFLRRGKKPQTECHDNIKSLAMVFAAMESSRKGKRIEISWR